MVEIKLETNKKEMAADVVMDALKTEEARINYSLSLARKRLSKFEEKYNISSEKFITDWTADDLEGKDLEYVEWAGEYKLASLLGERLETLMSIKYVF